MVNNLLAGQDLFVGGNSSVQGMAHFSQSVYFEQLLVNSVAQQGFSSVYQGALENLYSELLEGLNNVVMDDANTWSFTVPELLEYSLEDFMGELGNCFSSSGSSCSSS